MLPVVLLPGNIPHPPLLFELGQSALSDVKLSNAETSSTSPVFSNGVRTDTLLAQAITPGSADVGTVVNPGATQIDITGGQVSGDGANLFHSFQEFGLTEGQIANFIASPEIQNILGNVSGGNVSLIDGVLQISGSDANLYLINPAGIVFGANAALNLNGDFTATTADRLGFGDEWLDALSTGDYPLLVGAPNQFGFSAEQPGSVVNLGTLSVTPGQNITLMGGTVVNGGELSAADGTLTLLAVPGEKLVRINQADTLLGLEVSALPTADASQSSNPLSLPELLTGGSLGAADLALVTDTDGTVKIQTTSSTVPLLSGSTVVSGQVSTAGDQGGHIALLGERVSLLGADVDASGSVGGNVRVGGGFQGQGNVPNASRTLVDGSSQLQADGIGDAGEIIVWADDHTHFSGEARVTSATGDGGFVEISGRNSLVFVGQVDASAPNGATGTLLLDPTNIEVVAAGSDTNNLGDVDDVSDPDLGAGNTTRIDVAALDNANANIELQASNDITFSTDVNTNVGLSAIANNDININGNIVTDSDLNFQAGDNININSNVTADGSLTLGADTDGDGTGSVVTNPGAQLQNFGGDANISGEAVQVGTIDTNGGDLIVTADVNGDGTGGVTAIVGTQLITNGGTANVTGAEVQLANIDTTAAFADGGDVNVTSAGDISFEAINASSTGTSVGAGGDVTLTANGTVQGTGEVTPGTTIQTTGLTGNGTVQIQHDGGPDNVPFTMGDASENGTAGNIIADGVLSGVSSPVLPNGGNDTNIDPATGVTVTSVNAPPTLSADSQLPDTPANQALTFTLADINPAVTDSNSDNITFEIASIAAGTLLLNGMAVQPGDAIALTDTLEFIPPTDATGQITAFTLRASDGVSQSAAVPVSVALTDIPPTIDLPLDPTLGVAQAPPLPALAPEEQTFVLGMPLAQSPLLEELTILGAVLPEASLLIVGNLSILPENRVPTSGTINPGFLPNLGLQFTPGGNDPLPSLPGDPGTTTDIFPIILPNPELTDVPADPGGPEPSAPGQPGTSPDPGVPGSETLARRPDNNTPEGTHLNTNTVVGPPQGLESCQAQAQEIAMTTARTQTVYEGLIHCHGQNLAKAVELDNSAWVVYSLNNLAIAHFVVGDYLTALDFHEQQLEKAIKLDDATQQGIALGGIGAVYGALGDYATAIDYYQRSLDKMPIETAPQWKALTYRNLGNAYFAEKEYDRAADYQQTSLDISRGIKDTYGEMQAYGNLGHTYAIQGDFAGSIAAYEQGLALADDLNNDLETAQMLLGLSTTYAYQQGYDQSYDYAQQSLAIAQGLGARLGEGIALTNMGNALLYLNRLPEAEDVLHNAITIWESLRAGLGTHDAFKVAIFETQVAAYRNLEEVLVTQNKLEPALEISERGRARAFVELIARGKVNPNQAGPITPPSIEQMKQIARAQNSTLVAYTIIRDQVADTPHGASVQTRVEPEDVQLYIWVVQPTGDMHLRQVDLESSLQAQGTSLVKLVETSRDRSGIRGGFETSRSLAIRPGDQVRREGDPQDWAPYGVVTIDPRARTVTLNHPDFALPNPVVPLSEVYKVNSSAFATVLTQRQHWQDLYQLLIEPMADLLPSDPNARVVFVPQEQLFLVPFPALQAKDGSDLIEHHTILTAPAIQVLGLTSDSDNEAVASQPLVVGNPSPMPQRLQPLPHAGIEANGIADLLSTSALIGEAATETAIKQQLSTASLIHLATHGFFNESNPLQGSLAFAPTANQDGFLTAEEILGQSLQADLVVLSACDTGRGQITGDGVIGLSRSFLAAGANNVMVSLWQVPDDATAQLMIEFYQQRQALDNAQALRQAMLATREQYKDPAAWAAFTLIGAIE
ncbi:CHAT domain-containing protein [Leptothoe sp. ISB3NOV94-8A]